MYKKNKTSFKVSKNDKGFKELTFNVNLEGHDVEIKLQEYECLNARDVFIRCSDGEWDMEENEPKFYRASMAQFWREAESINFERMQITVFVKGFYTSPNIIFVFPWLESEDERFFTDYRHHDWGGDKSIVLY